MKPLMEYTFPDDLQSMNQRELELLAVAIRAFLIDQVSETGGHLASNLGVVELTIGLHKVFHEAEDKLIWDVGHQSYVHKILTGRADQFATLRKLDGLSGFPKKKEDPRDLFDTGHSSTSLSIAAGYAAARDLKGETHQVVAVIGDGSLTGGMAYEGLNNIGNSHSKVIIILNDNGMSISPNIGGMSDHLGKLRTSPKYQDAKSKVKAALDRVPVIGPDVKNAVSAAKEWVKYAVVPGGILFEELGFTYLGPVDGHNMADVLAVLEQAKAVSGPVVVQCITQKGKGYRPAEQNPNRFHGIGPFDRETGATAPSSGMTWSQVFGRTVLDLAHSDEKVTAVSAAMGTATGLGDFSLRYPKRFFDTGIAEAHAVTFASAMAADGMKPFVAIYSTFLQRAYDQIMEDVCLQGNPVVFGVDRAGIVGADGETHHGIFDLSYLLPMPGMTILAPCDQTQMEEMIRYAYRCPGPVAIRYPRGNCPEAPLVHTGFTGENLRLFQGEQVDILAVGAMVSHALIARQILAMRGIRCGVVDVARIKGDEGPTVLSRAPLVVTLEDNVVTGGFGQWYKAGTVGLTGSQIINLGWPDRFIEHGDATALYQRYGLDGQSIAERIVAEL